MENPNVQKEYILNGSALHCHVSLPVQDTGVANLALNQAAKTLVSPMFRSVVRVPSVALFVSANV